MSRTLETSGPDPKVDLLKVYVGSIPALYRAGFIRAAEGKCSPRQAIKAKCYECCGYEDVKSRISECASWRCPIHAFRPYQDNQPEGDDAA